MFGVGSRPGSQFDLDLLMLQYEPTGDLAWSQTFGMDNSAEFPVAMDVTLESRVAVTGVHHGDPGGEIDVTVAFHVPDVGAFALAEHHVEGMVVVSPVFGLLRDQRM